MLMEEFITLGTPMFTERAAEKFECLSQVAKDPVETLKLILLLQDHRAVQL